MLGLSANLFDLARRDQVRDARNGGTYERYDLAFMLIGEPGVESPAGIGRAVGEVMDSLLVRRLHACVFLTGSECPAFDQRYPDSVPDRLTPDKRSALMSRVRTKGTAPELALRRALWASGVRGWRLHPALPGKPDLVFSRRRVAVFVDGAFWHGHPDYYWGQSGKFWDEKIARNRARDERVNDELAALGWTVLRFWDFEVERELDSCVGRVAETLREGSRTSVR